MSEGYQFQVNVWQPSPDAKPVVERHVVHGRVVELGPNWVAEQLPRVADPDAPIADGRYPPNKRTLRKLIDVAACWQHTGFDACFGTHSAIYDQSICREVFGWLGLDTARQSSHGTNRPACMIGAVAAYLAQYKGNRMFVGSWCNEYKRCCENNGNRVSVESVGELYRRIAATGSTTGKEKIRVFFNTFVVLKAYCKGQKTIAFSDLPESVDLLVDPLKTT